MKNTCDTIGNLIRKFSAYSAVPPQTALPRTAMIREIFTIISKNYFDLYIIYPAGPSGRAV